MNKSLINDIISTLLATLILSVLSLIPSIVISSYGVLAEPEAQAFIPDTSKIYKREDVIRDEEIANKIIDEKIARLRASEGTGDYSDIVTRKSVWFSWIPWMLAPFLFRIAQTKKAYLLLLFPVFLSAAGAFSAIEILFFASSLHISKEIFKHKKNYKITS